MRRLLWSVWYQWDTRLWCYALYVLGIVILTLMGIYAYNEFVAWVRAAINHQL